MWQRLTLRVRAWASDNPDSSTPGAGLTGERLQARMRVLVTGGLVSIPLATLAGGASWPTVRAGLGISILALVIAVCLLFLVDREPRPWWTTYSGPALDVTFASGVLGYYLATGSPEVAIDDNVAFEIYFLAIALTCFRYQALTSAIAGLIAIVEYAVIVGWSLLAYPPSDPRHVPLHWPSQFARVLSLGLAATLAMVIVRRAERLRQLSTDDHLTGVFNRRHFDALLHVEVVRAWRYRRPFSVVILDVDHFKAFNDTYGHGAGDAALIQVAVTLRDTFRASDILARHGGEEFAVLMPETGHDDAVAKVEEARALIAGMTVRIGAKSVARALTFSAGVATAPEDGANASMLLKRADDRMYVAKALGRNRTVGTGLGAVELGQALHLKSITPIPGVVRSDGLAGGF